MLVEKIVKKSDGYYVQSEKGKNLGGPYKEKEDAERRLGQVEYFKNKDKKKVNESSDYRWKASYGDGREIIFVSKSYDDAMQYAASNSKGWDFSVKREESMPTLSGDMIEIPETAEPIYTDMRMGVPMNFYRIDGVIYDNLGFRVSDEELKELGLKETFKKEKRNGVSGKLKESLRDVRELSVSSLRELPIGFSIVATASNVFGSENVYTFKKIKDNEFKCIDDGTSYSLLELLYALTDGSYSWFETANESLKEGAEGKRDPGYEYVIYDYTDEDGPNPIVAIRSTAVEAEYLAMRWMDNDYITNSRPHPKYKDRYLTFEKVPKGKFKVGDDFYGPFDQDYNPIWKDTTWSYVRQGKKLESLTEGIDLHSFIGKPVEELKKYLDGANIHYDEFPEEDGAPATIEIFDNSVMSEDPGIYFTIKNGKVVDSNRTDESLTEDFSYATIRVFLDPNNENFSKDVKKLDSLCIRYPGVAGRLSFSDMYTIKVESDTQPGLKQIAKNIMWYIDRNIDSFVRYKNDSILEDIKNSVR